jgi:hypothetical protein
MTATVGGVVVVVVATGDDNDAVGVMMLLVFRTDVRNSARFVIVESDNNS